MNCLLLTFAILLSLYFSASSQTITWQTQLGGNSTDVAKAFAIARDGCYIVVGHSQSTNLPLVDKSSSDVDVYLVKTNSKGKTLWAKLYATPGNEQINGVSTTADGGFVIVGASDNPTNTKGGKDCFVIRTDALGKLLWAKNYGGSGSDEAIDVEVLEDGSILVLGHTQSADKQINSNAGGQDLLLLKLDKYGGLLWSKTYGGKGQEHAQALSLAYNEGNFTLADYCLVAGKTTSNDGKFASNHGKQDGFIGAVRIQDGESKWFQCLGGESDDQIADVEGAPNGKIYFCGSTRSAGGDFPVKFKGNADAVVGQININGSLAFAQLYGGSGEDHFNKLNVMHDNNLIVCGTTSSVDGTILEGKGQQDGWLLMMDGQAKMKWQKLIGGSAQDEFYAVKEVPSGDFAVVGSSRSTDKDMKQTPAKGGEDFWMLGIKRNDVMIDSFTPTTIQGYVKDVETDEFVKAEVRMVKNKQMVKVSSDQSDTTFGIYQVFLPDTNLASIGVFADGYMFYGQNVEISDDQRYGEIRLDIQLKKIKVGTNLDLFNIHFESGSPKLTDDSKPELERVVEFLNQNKKVSIQVNGHTDGTGPKDTKQKLSELRAQSVYQYLVNRGISPQRLTYRGFGMTKPLMPETSDENRQKNRRVEIEVTKN